MGLVLGIEEVQDEGDGVGGIVVGEAEADGVVLVVGAVESASVGSAVVAVLIVHTGDLLHHHVVGIEAPDYDIVGEGEVGVGAVEVEAGPDGSPPLPATAQTGIKEPSNFQLQLHFFLLSTTQLLLFLPRVKGGIGEE